MAQHGIARTSRVRTEEQRLLELDKITKYRSLEDQVRDHAARGDFSLDAFQLTSKLLRLNPEYYTIWNVRRRSLLTSGLLSRRSAVSSPSKASPSGSLTGTTTTPFANSSSSSSIRTPPGPNSQTTGTSGTTVDDRVEDPAAAEQRDLDILKSELGFTIPLLHESPKCYWIWNYRLWILNQAIERLPVPVARRIWEEELGLASKMLTRDQRNFHAWGYRRHVVNELESQRLNGASMVEAEFDYTLTMIRANLSNFSAWHRRSKLIPRYLDEKGYNDQKRREFLDEELGRVRDLLGVDPKDQSLWYYHQFLMLSLIGFAGRPTITPEFTVEDRITYATREIDEVKDLLESFDEDDDDEDDREGLKRIYEALLDYTLALCQFQERKPDGEEKANLTTWLRKMKELDPMRNGRWTDLERDLGLLGREFGHG
ncbi:hypothetical protein OQA88_2014 [Cercophora sp. LCS_1]